MHTLTLRITGQRTDITTLLDHLDPAIHIVEGHLDPHPASTEYTAWLETRTPET